MFMMDPGALACGLPGVGGIDAFTVLMLHGDGADAATSFPNSSPSAKTVTANGNVQVDTAQSKFGGASILCDGSGDYVSLADHADWDFGTGDFTIDFWFRVNSFPVTNGALVDVGGFTAGVDIYCSSTQFTVYIANVSFTRSYTVSTGVWRHVALIRTGTTARLFVDGVKQGADVSNSANLNTSAGVRCGVDILDGSNVRFDGWLDEIRISKGIARWTADFTPPTEAYSVPVC